MPHCPRIVPRRYRLSARNSVCSNVLLKRTGGTVEDQEGSAECKGSRASTRMEDSARDYETVYQPVTGLLESRATR